MEISIPYDKLRERGLFLATPMYGAVASGMFTKSVADLSALCAKNGIPLQLYFLFNESLIPRARNYCCDEFMRSNMQHMMFIDADIGFDPMDVVALMSLQINDEEKYDIIGAPYQKKCISWEKVKKAVDKGLADDDPNILERFIGDYVFNPKGGQQSIPLYEPVEVLEIGTGFMLVNKKAMLKFADDYKQYYYKPDHARTEHFDGSREIVQYFQAEIDQLDFRSYYESEMKRLSSMNIDNSDTLKTEITNIFNKASEFNNTRSKRYLSEDYWFCQKAQEIGLRTWLCPWMKLQHVGTYIFGGTLIDLAAAGVSATVDPGELKKKG